MILGDRDELAIEVERFEAPWDAVDPEQESLWGALAIWIAGENVTEHRRCGSDRVRADLHVPLLPLARWFLSARAALCYEERSPLGTGGSPHEDLDRWSMGPPPTGHTEDAWLDRRDEWWSEHFTGAATRDTVAPSIGIVRNDDRALVSWRVPALSRGDRTFLRPDGARVLSWAAVSGAFEEFEAYVAGWAPAGYGITTQPGPHDRALEYYTGLSSGEIDGFGFLPEAAADPAIDPLAQVVRDLTRPTAVGPARESIVALARASAQRGGRGWWDLRRQMIPAQGAFESDGYDGAQATRSLLSLDAGPLADIELLLRSVDIEVTDASPQATDRMLVAGTVSGRATTMVLSSARTETPWGRRFELARALGHLLLDPVRGEAIGAASGPHALASRRRRAGAFAAELLLPTSAMREASGGVLDGITVEQRFARLLHRFGVGANAAAFHLWNQGFLSSTEVRDDLVASR